MQKLIKISTTHYIIVNDSGIKEGDWCYNNVFNSILRIDEKLDNYTYLSGDKKVWFKITHSTHCLNCKSYDFSSVGTYGNTSYTCNHCTHKWGDRKPLSLSEVKEVISGYSVEKMALEYYPITEFEDEFDYRYRLGFIEGFKVYQELVKDNLFTIDDIKKAMMYGMYSIQYNTEIAHEQFIKSLLSPTEWNVDFVDDKIKLV